MSTFEIRTFESYDAFAREWHSATPSEADGSIEAARNAGLLDEQDTRHLWQLLGLLDDEEIVVVLPEWLAEEKVGFTDRSTPRVFVGRITRQTEKAVLFEDSAAARPLMALAHRINAIEDGLSNTADDDDRRDWLERRRDELREGFEGRDELVSLRDEWLPKSQVKLAFQRVRPRGNRP